MALHGNNNSNHKLAITSGTKRKEKKKLMLKSSGKRTNRASGRK